MTDIGREAINAIRRAMMREGKEHRDIEAVKEYVRTRSDEQLRSIGQIGPHRLASLRAWGREEPD